MGLWKRQVSRFQVGLALYRQMGFFSLNPGLRKMWLEKERLTQEVKDLEQKSNKAFAKLDSRNQTLYQEAAKLYSI